ncbi:glycoside-pentoside-hexuronide (GPH):cation symporter [Lachnospira multipara]|uniref:glycoside-pentoside-hexuronide (GPH):cation symporter n=1 Tax=Lachnospira multipara TaxID=28051 RepID=UPI00054F32BA|nr:glycoside-pentoside-hexuronide (GPH):cation symporter [Lachnospira multipara]
MLSLKEKIAYGLGAVGKDMVYMLSASYILYYYQDVLGVSAVAMGIILLVARIFDAFNDPIMGVIVAKTKSKFGKFRLWLLIGTVTNAIILYFMFACPPSLDGAGLTAYAAVFYIIWGVTYTMMDIPYWSMIPAFTNGGKEREGLTTLARSCAGVGSAIITIFTMMLVHALGGSNEKVGFKYLALIVAILFVIFICITVFTIKEKSSVNMETPSVSTMFKSLINNDQAMAVVIAIVLINCAVYITSNLVIYFFKYDFGGGNWYESYTYFNMFGGAIQILAMMFMYTLLRKFFSNIQIFYICLLFAILGYASLLGIAFTSMNNVFVLFIPGFFIFAANGILQVLTTVFLANTVDYGQLKTGRRDESVIFSMQTFVVKLASGIAAFVASVCLSINHLQSGTEVSETDAVIDFSKGVSQASRIGLRTTMTVIPIIGLFIAVLWFKKKYILTDKKIEEITKEIHKNN